MKKQLMEKVQTFKEALGLSSLIFLATMKGGNSMMIHFLALNILDGLLTLEEIKNKKLRKLVKAELDKMGVGEVADATDK